MLGQDREQLRRAYVDAWLMHRSGSPQDARGQLIAEVILLHPEYHALLEGGGALDRDFDPGAGESNPYMHMGLHIAIREQLSVDRPPGICAIHRQILGAVQDIHTAEHQMLECLGAAIWQAQPNSGAPDAATYMDCLRRLAG